MQNRLTDYEKIFDKYAYSLNLNDYIEDILNRNSNRQVMQKKIDARIVDERYQLLILKRKLEHEECFENRQAVYTAIEEFEDDIIEYLFECDFEKVWYGIHRYEDRKAVLLSELEQFIELADVMIKFYSLHSFDEIAKDQERIKFKNKEIESDVDEE